jgi:ferrous iron transport protein B
MSPNTAGPPPQVALAGNPNAGKTSIFNCLTGASLKVGNYPGITVERHAGKLNLEKHGQAEIFDIPGTYSLAARSPEEQIASRAVLGLPPMNAPDLVVIVVDATQLLRNLYLALQILETGAKAVVALTMVDLLESSGKQVDSEQLALVLGVPVIRVSGLHGTGTEDLRRAIDEALAGHAPQGPKGWAEPAHLREDLLAVQAQLPASWKTSNERRNRSLAAWALLSIDEEDELIDIPDGLRSIVDERRSLAAKSGVDVETDLIRARYDWIDEHGLPVLRQVHPGKTSFTSRIDALLLHPVLGFALFLLAMGLVFQSLFSWADPGIVLVESIFGWVSEQVVANIGEGLLRDFITEGLIAGVGGVVVFLPQILILFFFIGLMEDTGYMARIAFLMDRIMKMVGLHGRAFVPMLSGLACAVPAILATRTMERRRDRMITMMAVPLMSCSARLPVYTLLIAALYDTDEVVLGFIPVPALLMVAMYVFSTIVALAAAGLLGRTLFRGPQVPLILELPPYRMPQLRGVVRMMLNRSGVFLREAGGVILVCTIGLWLLLTFPKGAPVGSDFDQQRVVAEAQLEGAALVTQLELITNDEDGAIFRNSYGARLGRTIEPTIEPLGFDWKIGIGLIGAFAAREVFVSTMGIVYGVSADVDEKSVSLREKLHSERWPDGSKVYTPLVGLSLMIFFALACQCMSTLAAVYRETHSIGWPVFMFVYMTTLAWVTSFAVYQGGLLLGFA